MFRNVLVAGFTLIFSVSAAVAADTAPNRANLTATEIANKNIQARGGLQAWRAVQTISWTGKLGAGGNQRSTLPIAVPDKPNAKLTVPQRPKEEVQLPFTMEMQRPRKVRFELQFHGQTAFQVYDGANGWKFRPYLNRKEIEPYSPEELKIASMGADIDGPIVDFEAKGTKVELDGMEKVEDRDTYKLKLTTRDGHASHVWIDAQTFLEAKIEGQPRRLDGKEHPVEIYYRDYRAVNGLQIPFVLETKVLPISNPAAKGRENPIPVEKIVIEKVAVNPKLDASLFGKPAAALTSAPSQQ